MKFEFNGFTVHDVNSQCVVTDDNVDQYVDGDGGDWRAAMLTQYPFSAGKLTARAAR